ncbi:NAD(P)-binding protein [Panus rudis PR-1116 ss-1]|nr:NAD(P)-binding protein [Panus rudis PR-1116 ss-1]
MASPKVWLITGCSSGLGRAVAEYALSKGGIVVATARKPETLEDLRKQYPSESQLLVLRLDVTVESEIEAVFAKIKETYGRLDVLYNNAAFSILAEVEGAPLDLTQKLFATNFWGAGNVMKEAVKFFREVNEPGVGGRIINASSLVGITSIRGFGHYSASKHALEALSDAIAQELDPEWNIKVTLLVLGSFRTKGLDNTVTLPAHSAYNKPTIGGNPLRGALKEGSIHQQDPDKAAAKIYEVAYMTDPPLRLPVGADAVATIKAKSAHLAEVAEKYGSWADLS